MRDVTNACGAFQNGTRGLKARFSPGASARPLKGRSSTGLSAALFGAMRLPASAQRDCSVGNGRKFQAELGRTVVDEQGERLKSAVEERAFKARVKRLTKRTGFSPLGGGWWKSALQRRVKAFLRSGPQPVRFLLAAVTSAAKAGEDGFLVHGTAEAVPLPKPSSQSWSGIGATTADSSVAQNSRSVGMTIQKQDGRERDARPPHPSQLQPLVLPQLMQR